MNRDEAHREIQRLIGYYSSLPFARLLTLAAQAVNETEIVTPQGITLFTVEVVKKSTDSVRINVSALGDNWWKLQRIDESVVVSRGERCES